MSQRLNILEKDEPWYASGLNFKCTECGQCCTGSPGYTWVSDEEIIAMAAHLKLTIDEFSRKYLRKVGQRISLLEHSTTFNCVFLKDKKCQIYALRPKQCRTYPCWPQNLKSREDWENAAKYCEGINRDSTTVPYSKIQEQLDIQLKN